MRTLILMLILVSAAACNKKDDTNVLTDYVKKPLDKAEAVNEINDLHNQRLDQHLQDLDQ